MVHNKRLLGVWNKKQSFMASEGLTTDTQNAILLNTENCTVLNSLDTEKFE